MGTALHILLACVSLTVVYANDNLLSNYVDRRDVGVIIGDVTDLKLLNAFVRANPRLPEPLKVTALTRGAIIYVSVKYDNNRAIIGVVAGAAYSGYVEITYNGGQASTEAYIPVDHSAGGNNYHSRLNLSRLTNVLINLGEVRNNKPSTIRKKFMSLNEHLPNDLSTDILQVRVDGNRALLFVPEGGRGSSDYIGQLYVTFTVRP